MEISIKSPTYTYQGLSSCQFTFERPSNVNEDEICINIPERLTVTEPLPVLTVPNNVKPLSENSSSVVVPTETEKSRQNQSSSNKPPNSPLNSPPNSPPITPLHLLPPNHLLQPNHISSRPSAEIPPANRLSIEFPSNQRISSTGSSTSQQLQQQKKQELYHYARVYRSLASKEVLNLTIQQICKMAFIHKLLNKYVVRRRVSSMGKSCNTFPLGSLDFEVVGENEQGYWTRLMGFLYDYWVSWFHNEDFGALYYRDWKYVNIKVGR